MDIFLKYKKKVYLELLVDVPEAEYQKQFVLAMAYLGINASERKLKFYDYTLITQNRPNVEVLPEHVLSIYQELEMRSACFFSNAEDASSP